MKLRSIMAAATAALLLASCSDDSENHGGLEAGKSEASRLNISFTVPAPAGVTPRGMEAADRVQTRTQGATTNESDVQTLSVYIFNTSGAAITGNNTHLAVTTHFSSSDGGITYTLNETIESVAGTADIYVILNHPVPNTNYANKGVLLAAIDDITAMSVNTKFTMFAAAAGTTLLEYDENNASTTTTNVNLHAGRVVSKLVTTSKDATYTATWSNGVTLTYSIEAFGVYQEAIKSYLAKQSLTLSPFDTSAFSPYATSVLKDNKTVDTGTDHQQGDVALTNLGSQYSYYIGENIPQANNTLNKNTTYAMVATKVGVSHFAKWNDTTKEVDWIAATHTPADTDDLYIVNYLGASYITNVKSDVEDITLGLDGNTGTLSYYTFPEGYVHFQVFLNPDAQKNNYAVGRNEFIHVKVTGIKTLDGYFPGYPGGDGENGNPDPDKPIDPNDGNNGNNPDPKDPDEKVDPEAAQINVKITIDEWDYKDNSVVLE